MKQRGMYIFRCFVLTSIFLSVIFSPLRAYAGLVLNEIYPAPVSGFEWVELYNNENTQIDLSLYTLTDLAGNQIKLNATTSAAFEFIIATASGVLNNTGDTLFLKKSGQLVDIATYSGTFDSTQSYVKCPDSIGMWYKLSTQTQKSSNQSSCIVLTPTPTATPSAVPSPSPTLAPITPTDTPTPLKIGNVLLSEVHANPETGNEWVELYNNNSNSVTLTNWYIDDKENEGATPKQFSVTIPAYSFSAVDFSSSFLNNDGDAVRLLYNDKTEADNTEYSVSTKGKSFSRQGFNTEDNWCSTGITKNAANSSCENMSTTTGTTTSTQQTLSSSSATTPKPLINKIYIPKNPIKVLENNLIEITLNAHTIKKTQNVLGARITKIYDAKKQDIKTYLTILQLTFRCASFLSLAFFAYVLYAIYNVASANSGLAK